jgi:CRP-like cAMP-binding protein
VLELLRGAEIAAGLSEEELGLLAALGRAEVHERGKVILRAGDPVSTFWLVASGVVEIGPVGGRGGRRRLERGRGFGELALFEETPSPVEATAAVTPETRLAAWHLVDVQPLLAAHPPLAAKLARNLLRKLAAQLQAMEGAIRALGSEFEV